MRERVGAAINEYGEIPRGFHTFKALIVDAISAALEKPPLEVAVPFSEPCAPAGSGDVTVYISIGNSDDKLSQREWARFCVQVRGALGGLSMHGAWFSLPGSEFQNACWCVVIPGDLVSHVRMRLHHLAAAYGQDSIAWAPAHVEFLKPLRLPDGDARD